MIPIAIRECHLKNVFPHSFTELTKALEAYMELQVWCKAHEPAVSVSVVSWPHDPALPVFVTVEQMNYYLDERRK